MSDMRNLEDVVLDLIQHCRGRCGSGFGKYPLGMRDAISALLPLVNQDHRGRDDKTIRQKVQELDERLSR